MEIKPCFLCGGTRTLREGGGSECDICHTLFFGGGAGEMFTTKKGNRGSVLLEAHKTINGERQDVYGSPEDSFALIAKYWTTYLRSTIEAQKRSYFMPSDVAMMMALFKIAREANQHKRDNLVDCAGYLGIYADMQEVEK